MNKVFILNKIFDGSWNDIDGNISHEIIDFVLTDYGKYYVYNVPRGSCPNWIKIIGDDTFNHATHEAQWLLLTSESHNNTFSVLYRIKLIRRLHNKCYSKDWSSNEQLIHKMDSIYKQNQLYYGGKLISEIIDNSTPLVTFEADYMEMAVEPIEVSFKEYNYQRNKGYVKSDEATNDYTLLRNKLNKAKWVRASLNPLNPVTDNRYTKRTFLDLILKTKSEECYTNMLYSILNEPNMMLKFCHKFAPDYSINKEKTFNVFREHSLVAGRMDICADNGSQRVVIENKLTSGLHGLKQDSSSQLTNYYDWATQSKRQPICFLVAPDYRVLLSHENRLGQLEREIKKYDSKMLKKYTLVPYSEISTFIEENKKSLSKNYIYIEYIDDIIAAFRRYSYSSKSEYYQSLLQERI